MEWADSRASMDKANKNSVSAVGAEKDVKYTEKSTLNPAFLRVKKLERSQSDSSAAQVMENSLQSFSLSSEIFLRYRE